jgi:peptidoglycan/LPS O-acetylase OafA/YrhL
MWALDGLRGAAAVSVLLGHCMLLIPAVEEAFRGKHKPRADMVGLVTYSPLHVAWAGGEAVMVFFVLSGFVLTRAADNPRFSWRAYYPSRLLRLYLPVAGALIIAAAARFVVPRTHSSGTSTWLRSEQHITFGVRSFVHDLLLVRGVDKLLPPLWSLRWEVVFSLLLPAVVFGACRRWPLALAQFAVLLGVTLLSSNPTGGNDYLRYLPVFAIGSVMARQHHRLVGIGRRLTTTTGALVAVLGLLLLTLSWTARRTIHGGLWNVALGAALIVFAFGYWQPLRAVGETRPLQWLGRRSFSLYLVHFPIVLSTAILLGSRSRFAFVIAVPLSLFAAHVFFRLVEGPSHRFSQSVKAKLTSGIVAVRIEPDRPVLRR